MKNRAPLLLATSMLLCSCGGPSSTSLSRVPRTTSAPAETSLTQQKSEESKEKESQSQEKTNKSVSNPAEESQVESKEESREESETSIESSSLAPKPTTVSDIDPKDSQGFFNHYYATLNNYRTYCSVTSGKTVAKVLFIETTQSIENLVYKDEYSYLKNLSDSSIVHCEHVAYYHADAAVCKNQGEENWTKSTLDEYLDKYGTFPFDRALEGYITDADALLSFSIEKADSEYKVHVSFDPEKSTVNAKIQMKAFGQLDDYPKFKNLDIDLYVREDFTPSHLDLVADYAAKKIMESDCHQTYTVTFSKFNEAVEVPNVEEMKKTF